MYFYNCESFFTIVGILFSCRIILILFFGIYEIFCISVWYRFFPKDVKKYGKYAVITGATDGIGQALGLQLAKRGMNIVLISRSMEKLEKTAREFKKEQVDVRIIQQDFCSEISTSIRKKLKIDIGILINNVGGALKQPCKFLELSDRDLVSLINLNIGSVLMMSRIVLPDMLLKRRGVILNVSSLASLQPFPLISNYSACKSFMRYLSLGLWYEYRNSGVAIQCLIPSAVSTKILKEFGDFSNNTLSIPNAEKYASSAVNAIGTFNQSTGYWWHELYRISIEFIPTWIMNKILLFIAKELLRRKKIKS